jgi:type 1 fimbriae regulatory protein FimE
MARQKTSPGTPEQGADDKVDLYLEEREVNQLRKAAAMLGRNGHRDQTMIQLAYNHGFRASELCRLKWQHVNLEKETMYVIRCKGSKSGQHYLYPEDIKALSKLGDEVGYVFKSEAKQTPGPLSPVGFHKIVQRAGKKAGLGSHVHPHQLRHACGHRLREEGWDVLDIQQWLGHRNIQNTQHYAAADATHFRKLIERESKRRARA